MFYLKQLFLIIAVTISLNLRKSIWGKFGKLIFVNSVFRVPLESESRGHRTQTVLHLHVEKLPKIPPNLKRHILDVYSIRMNVTKRFIFIVCCLGNFARFRIDRGVKKLSAIINLTLPLYIYTSTQLNGQLTGKYTQVNLYK